jgi:hypothetical protein
MKNRTYIFFSGTALCAVAFYIANTGKFFGAFINRFAPCMQSQENSFPCYGVYDIALMVCAAVLGAIFFGMLLWSLYKSSVRQ